MKGKIITLIILITTILSLTSALTPTKMAQKKTIIYSNFVKTSCNSTTYPSVCLKSLLPYATAVKKSPRRLVNAALSAALKSSTAALKSVSTLAAGGRITKSEADVIKDCIENIKDSIDEIKDSIKAMADLGRSRDKSFVISNAQTWTSAAITDENTCLDGFSDRKVNPVIKNAIRTNIVGVARLSSNALYLINNLKL